MSAVSEGASPLAWWLGALGLSLAMLAAAVVGKMLRIDSPRGRNVAIDGLRGYLAYGVFLHHGVIWYFYVRGAPWVLPPVSIYRDLGATCVSLFFMITAHLFIGKLLDARQRPLDWTKLFASRVVRLTPLYVLAMAVLFIEVGVLSGWHLHEPASRLVANVARWLAFSILGANDLNHVHPTAVLIGLVTWTLAYEWMFYLALPIIAVVLRVKVPAALVVGCACAVGLWIVLKHDLTSPLPFVLGAASAFVARRAGIARLLRKPIFGGYVLLIAGFALFSGASGPVLTLLLGSAFCVVACGNDVFRLLSNRAAVVLGDISYGIYLLHALVLSTVFLFVVGPGSAAVLSPMQHWVLVWCIGTVVVVVASTTYRYIELPCMRRVTRLVAWIPRGTSRWSGVGRSDSAATGAD